MCSNDAQSYVFSTGNDLFRTLQLQKTANYPQFATKKASISSFFHKNSDTVLANLFFGQERCRRCSVKNVFGLSFIRFPCPIKSRPDGL